jgi:prepilin-type N-terminal cleavage/methylation domain-containing protein
MNRRSSIEEKMNHQVAKEYTPGEPRTEKRVRGFSLIELLVAIAVLSIMLVMLAEMTGMVADTWAKGENRVETYQSARAALELMSREMTPAVVDTRMQFAILPGEELEDYGATNIALETPCVLWMAPLGEKGDLRCVGYYLFRDDAKTFYRLKRIYISSEDDPDTSEDETEYFPLVKVAGDEFSETDTRLRVDPWDADWFMRDWDAAAFDEQDPANRKVVVSTVADGVIAYWVQAVDLLGNPVPWFSEVSVNSGKTDLLYNSAGFFNMATTTPFDNGDTTVFLAETNFTMKANRVPAAVDITVVTVDVKTLARRPAIPTQTNVMRDDGSLDVEESIRLYNKALIDGNLIGARTFTTRVKLVNGS